MIQQKGLQKALVSEGYLVDLRTASSVEACLHTRPTAGAFLFGPAGSGKTYLPEVLGRILKREVFFFQCFPGTREDDLLVKLIPDEKKKSGIAVHDGVIVRAAKASQKKSVLLVLDEWDKTRPSADSFLLDFLQSGRINFNGKSCTANQENLTVFITMNDEREISEPLLRRLPLIQFSHLSPALIKDALNLTHAGHPYLSSAVMLYERCLIAGMPKPATIQELRQLLDAITVLGSRADWDSLVFQFVTKTKENHLLLKNAERIEISFQQENEGITLDPEAYKPEVQQEDIPETVPPAAPKMPSLAEVRGITSVSDDTPETLPEGVSVSYDPNIAGIVELSDATYDAFVGLAKSPSDDPCRIGDVAGVVGNKIVAYEPVSICDINKISNLWGKEGSIVITLPNVPYTDILNMRNRGWKIVKYSTSEIIARTTSCDLRWTPQSVEAVVEMNGGRAIMRDLTEIARIYEVRRACQKPLPSVEGCATHMDYYRKCGIPSHLWGDWCPHNRVFTTACNGWARFLMEVGE